MVGTIGGALGLFVGFSFYDFIVMFINYISKKCEKVNPEPDDSSSDLKTMKENLDILRAGMLDTLRSLTQGEALRKG